MGNDQERDKEKDREPAEVFEGLHHERLGGLSQMLAGTPTDALAGLARSAIPSSYVIAEAMTARQIEAEMNSAALRARPPVPMSIDNSDLLDSFRAQAERKAKLERAALANAEATEQLVRIARAQSDEQQRSERKTHRLMWIGIGIAVITAVLGLLLR